MRILVVIVAAATLAGCVNIRDQKPDDGSACHDIAVPFFHYTNCPPAPLKAGT